ncbi:helix-turn-helix domain-containing protein [Lacticaseibacillus casei]|uniref:Helix-turn-helix domain-containing protein n=1 Tax=Lacticaseibacillus huelsenbergensis TaxID=3035291 RepID=A0ABY8DUJ2_9LACO|nr:MULTISPECIES: Rgg/GadR/MutR family transcriptional regulator [Lacticaseibacillus]MDG3061312.1 helix-turn-helix domain-containing protein [Lacticaseibacillus sp. BCRC 81376]QVI38791.1 helix-turn-helix domain-containing protein [Lacticaseibacillus casei]QXG60601.1 helix-turn-helix domain-containing protein [Lacticaseibacillus casei]WFB40648.1 helix-turn-helix domain-containing protein [Lacticaseibacillus huelsenbergensis]WFB43396.1 helix-turn-helix domain-containing protein [Lacticaseibacillu
MENFGATFKYLRESRGITLSSLADDVVSKGMISKFENGTSDLSTKRFFHLLKKLYITPFEFTVVMNHFEPLYDNKFATNLTQSALNNDFAGLKRLADSEYARWQNSHSIFDQLNWIMAECVRAEAEKKPLSDKVHLNVLTNYLFQCEDWGNFELVLYGNTMTQLPIETITVFSQTLLDKCSIYIGLTSVYETCINVLLNTVALLIRHGKTQHALKTLAILEQKKLPESFLLERVLLNYYKGILLTQTGRRAEGDQLIDSSLQALKAGDCVEFVNSLKKDLAKLGLYHI